MHLISNFYFSKSTIKTTGNIYFPEDLNPKVQGKQKQSNINGVLETEKQTMGLLHQRKANPQPELQLESNSINTAKPLKGLGSGSSRNF